MPFGRLSSVPLISIMLDRSPVIPTGKLRFELECSQLKFALKVAAKLICSDGA